MTTTGTHAVTTGRAVCAKCGMPITRDSAGWMHKLPPMPMSARRKYRHVITPTAREEN